jgi:hypothetical protein
MVGLFGAFGFAGDGSLVWAEPNEALTTGDTIAVGDTDGDGEPDLCFAQDDRLLVVSADGRTLLDEATPDPFAFTDGGCALADLDADGNFEVVAYGGYGLRLYDVESETLLAERTDFCSTSWRHPPIVADVDGDGSAEIVVAGLAAPCDGYPIADHVYVVGPASGRWARGRPVWNQAPYDATLVADDGHILRFPRSNVDTINAFRAQPARDGDLPDLEPEVVDACADDCEAGEVELSVRVLNHGSQAAAAGATVVVYSQRSGGGLVAIGSTTIAEAIPAGWASGAQAMTVPAAAWGDRRVIEVTGMDARECDPLNDRVESGIPDPCPAD